MGKETENEDLHVSQDRKQDVDPYEAQHRSALSFLGPGNSDAGYGFGTGDGDGEAGEEKERERHVQKSAPQPRSRKTPSGGRMIARI